MKISGLSLLLAGALALAISPARADSTWNVSSGNWDVDGNWIGGAPTSSDAAMIDNSGTAQLPGGVSGVYGTLNIGAAGVGALEISGGLLTGGTTSIGFGSGATGAALVTGGTWNVDGLFVDGYSGTGSLTITDTGVVRIGSGSGALILGGGDTGSGTLNIGKGGAAGTLQASEVAGGYYLTGTGVGLVNFNHTGTVNFAPRINGNIAVTEMGPGTTILSGSNGYTGGTTLQDGTLLIERSDSIGTGALTINGGTMGNSDPDGFLFLENNLVVNGDFGIQASGTSSEVDNHGNVDLGTGTRTITLSGEGLACFGGNISGENLTLLSATGTSMAMFCSDISNTFSGTLRVGSGVDLQLWKIGNDGDPPVIAVAGDAVIDAGGMIDVWVDNQFSGTSNVTVNGTLLQSTSATTTINTLSGTGSIISEISGQILKLSSGTFAGTIREDGGVQTVEKQGAGLLVLSGSNSYTGGTLIHSGTLAAAHHNAVGTAQVTVDGGVFLVEAAAGGVANTVKLSGGGYNRAFSGSASLAGAVDASSNFSGGRDTSATILAGTLGGASMLQTRFATTSSALNDSIRLSDVYTFQGTGTDVFTLQLSIADAGPNTYLAWLDTNTNLWVNAVAGNTGNNASLAQQNYAGSFADFQIAYGTDLSAYLGAYGVETSAGTTHAWAVVNHNSDFSIVPEPSTYALLGFAALALGIMAARSHRTERRA